jgi:predicted amidophosphoribosyltransferase
VLLDVTRLRPEPAGFGDCGRCAYRDGGSAAICFSCAIGTLAPLPADRCGVCEHPTDAGAECANPVCSWDDRAFSRVWAVSLDTGRLRRIVRSYKYPPEHRDWAVILGRILAGYLDHHATTFERFDLIVPMPAYTGEDARRSWNPVELIVQEAAIASTKVWPFELEDPPAIVQTADVPSLVGKSWHDRHEITAYDLQDKLSVPRPARVADRDVLVVDDIFTDGLRAHEVAWRLRRAGARDVCEVVLARHVFGS